MVLMLALKWWYKEGWLWLWRGVIIERSRWLNEAFSISALVRTWMSPFKQTYSSAKQGSIDLRVRAIVDNFVSRLVGTLLRTVIIFVGLLGIGVTLIFGLVSILIWPFIPLAPIFAVILFVSGASV